MAEKRSRIRSERANNRKLCQIRLLIYFLSILMMAWLISPCNLYRCWFFIYFFSSVFLFTTLALGVSLAQFCFFLFVSLFFVLSSICWCVVYLISAVTMIACSEWDEPDVSDYSHTHKHMSRTQTWDGMAWQIEVRWTHDARHTHHTYNMTQEHAATSACQMDIRMILIT